MKILLALLLLALIPAIAYANGGKASPTPTQTAAGGSASIAGGDQTVRGYGVGGTGLTSTAPCLESTSVIFGLVAATHVSKGCVLRLYSAQCKDEACRQKMRCADPDLMDEGKAALGCKP